MTGTPSTRTIRPATSVLLAIISAAAWACPYSIRDAGFIVRDPDPYHLVLAVAGDDGEHKAAAEAFNAACDQYLKHSNVSPAVVNVEADPADELMKSLEQLPAQAREKLPFVALISPDGKALPCSIPVRAGKENWQQIAQWAVTSPVREQIAPKLITEWCTIVFVGGQDAEENAEVRQAVKSAAKSMAGFKPEMGDRIKRPPWVVDLGETVPQAEKSFVWALGLEDGDLTRARAAIVFGMGRRLGPTFWGADATEDNLKKGLKLLGRNCTCTADPSRILGPVAPMAWDRERMADVREVLGFDPNSPAAISALSGVWTNFKQGETGQTPGDYLPDPGGGYVEFGVEFGDEQTPPDEEAPPGEEEPPDPAQRGEAPTVEDRGMKAVTFAAAALGVLAIGGSAIVLLRNRGRV